MTTRGLNFARIAVILFAVILSSCSGRSDQIIEISGPIMGTSYHIKVVVKDTSSLENIESKVVKAMTEVDALMSTYKPLSEISQFNNRETNSWVELNSITFEVIKKAVEISKMSDGAFDITIGPLVLLWGFGPEQKPEKIPTQEVVTNALTNVGYENIQLNNSDYSILKLNDIYIDLSAIAKGYAVDKVAEALDSLKVADYLVEIGGEIRASGTKPGVKPWILAIESPISEGRQVWQKISIGNNALATSGDYRNYYEENGVRYSHTIDPATGFPVQHKLTSVTVLHPSSAEADAMATMLMVMGEEKGYELAVKEKIAAYFIYRSEDGFAVKHTKEFNQYLVE